MHDRMHFNSWYPSSVDFDLLEKSFISYLSNPSIQAFKAVVNSKLK
jgi:hypothetical protein